MIRDTNTPALAVLILLSLFTGLVQLGQIVTQQSVPTVNKGETLGVDYREIYFASRLLRNGWNPYDAPRFVYPPLPAQVNVPAMYLPFDTVKYIVSLAVLVSVLAAMLLLHRIFAPPNLRADLLFTLMTVGILSLSYPFQFLFDRGNLDGFVLLLTAIGLYWLYGAGLLAGVMFGLAVSLKVYPILLALPLLAKRRWKPVASMAALLFILFELSMELWLFFIQDRVLARGGQFRVDENGSLAVTFTYLEWFASRALGMQPLDIEDAAPSSLARPFYLALIALMVWADLRKRSFERRQLCADVALYIPFMVAMPQLAYHYQLVWLLGLIPVVGWLWTSGDGRAQRLILLMVTCGIALSQFPAVAAQNVIGSVTPHFIPGFGLLLVMLGVVAHKWTTQRSLTG